MTFLEFVKKELSFGNGFKIHITCGKFKGFDEWYTDSANNFQNYRAFEEMVNGFEVIE